MTDAPVRVDNPELPEDDEAMLVMQDRENRNKKSHRATHAYLYEDEDKGDSKDDKKKSGK